MQSAVSIKDLKISYGDHAVIEKMSLDIKPREFLVLLGPSGCGKSTLLNSIAGLQDITDGEIWISGKNVTWEEPRDRGIGMVFQSYALYPRMTVRKNLSFGLRVAGLPKAEIETRVARTASLLHLDALLDRYPAALSGGQRQRVAIGRALARQVDVFLFDEPLSNLDAKLRNELRVEIKKLHQDLGNTMIYVTHDQVEALTLADRIAIMKDGVIQQLAAPSEIYHRPVNLFVAGFIGAPAMNFVEGKIVLSSGNSVFESRGVRFDLSAYRFTDGPVPGPATLGVRPEHVAPNGGQAGLQTVAAKVSVVEPMGAESVVWFDWGGSSFSYRVMDEVSLQPGAKIAPGIDIAKASLFGADGRRL
ncbi:carbohydrate ABC transporter ATP-binding protein, CUT1 family [Rhizobium tibeticum]|uniref:Carbohydrate ABC transporter ATP-binding protein, CUT1 family n=1 Tax=Rhizobium tibeticum TaxID=501024 RepID=A0A1H8ULJ8_9HYPH|nr:ATP-binding cassette domain-containing protein [Rhizobium tibeticum]SEI17568.1 sn-glycerol-3-phosphate import ATP-binding protein UgpC [Rhizobium tibeticum]SEP04085.1 carbohydrate ABC transporter ATP-binding protein, CUT1 family [Rhizobium tibeticum]